jgi:AcrR family transcriptional regulator
MADVAAAAGCSSGSIYTYVESKEALFYLAVSEGLGHESHTSDLPVPTPPFTATLQLIDAGLKSRGATPLLRSASRVDVPDNVLVELASIVEEQYAMVGSLRRVLSMLEKCALDLPELDELYFGRRRRGQIDLLTTYLHRRVEGGYLRAYPDTAVAAQIVTEAVAWFAWKRLEGHDVGRFDDELSRRTVVEFVCNALTRIET